MILLRISVVRSWRREDIIELYKSGGWWEEGTPAELVDRIIKGSFLFVVAEENGRAVGMARVLSDGVSDAYIQDFVVHPSYRGKGIGREILRYILGELKKRGITWIGLIAQPGTMDFYRKEGFAIMEGHTPMRYRGGEDV
ncbi:MAG: N-acetyltransferase [Thermoplasmata archaeon]|nr:MAG: N-acetyltransferase [Thermoplasmata archaeon]RLF70675.1 MAG: N-acetyltransferase [Thermoplasmata archaeon]RLF71289.1 MAG: N-acetyltransferase [Thermoplasmata archaeon]